jgi:uncharacterized protein
MKKLSMLIAIMFFALITNGQTNDNCLEEPSITVTGTATMQIIPDKIYVNILLTEKDRNDKKQLNEIENLFFGVLEKLHINKDDLSLSDANSNFIRIPWKGKKINKTKEYQLMVKDVNTLSLLIDELDMVDISNVSVSYVDHSNIENFRKDVKIQAIVAAKDKAEYLLKAIGKELGDPIKITEDPINMYSLSSAASNANILIRGQRSSGTVEVVDNQVGFEKIELKFAVDVKFKIKN